MATSLRGKSPNSLAENFARPLGLCVSRPEHRSNAIRSSQGEYHGHVISIQSHRSGSAPLLGTGAMTIATMSAASLAATLPTAAAGNGDIRPFRVKFADEKIVDMRRRINTTRWPDRETVMDESQGVQLAAIKEIARYWGTDYDWRKCESKLNSLPQFIDRDRWSRHPFHPRSLETRKCAAADRDAWVARLDHRAAQDCRSPY